jgi:processive 1,2-diacylglycerol beta-glucosyltransferase
VYLKDDIHGITAQRRKLMAKILVLTSYGGGGHISASQALSQYLSDEHEVQVVPFFIDVLDPMDPVKFLTRGKYHVETIYNYLLRRKKTRAINTMAYLCGLFMPIMHPFIKKHLKRYIKRHGQFDLIISVIPWVNESILEVAQQENIPFLLIPTDLDSSTFLHRIHEPAYKQFFLSLPFNNSAIFEKISRAHIAKSQIVVSGFPIRKSFFMAYDKKNLKKEFAIPENKLVLLLMMGAEGSSSILTHVKQLITIPVSFHIIILLGRNAQLESQLRTIQFPEHISFSIIGFTDRIAELMTIADLCLTKSGSVSVSECLYKRLPVILDGTGNALQWERFNLHFIKNNQLGDVVRRFDEVPTIVQFYLTDTNARNNIAAHLAQFEMPNFERHVRLLVNKMI